jgi:hypothetical protein
MLCEMSGCEDFAEYFAEFEPHPEDTQSNFEICAACAKYWEEHAEEHPKITTLAIYRWREKEDAK